MTDDAFLNELWINAYKNQIDGYPMGHPRRTEFKPIVVTFPGTDGQRFNRQLCVDNLSYTFTDEEKKLLLEVLGSRSGEGRQKK